MGNSVFRPMPLNGSRSEPGNAFFHGFDQDDVDFARLQDLIRHPLIANLIEQLDVPLQIFRDRASYLEFFQSVDALGTFPGSGRIQGPFFQTIDGTIQRNGSNVHAGIVLPELSGGIYQLTLTEGREVGLDVVTIEEAFLNELSHALSSRIYAEYHRQVVEGLTARLGRPVTDAELMLFVLEDTLGDGGGG